MAFSAGENVGPYRIIEQLGQGGMATVFKAYHPALDRDVAIKVLHATFKDDTQFYKRFEREAQIVAKLEHPHIIPVYDFSEHDGEPYLVMRYVQGKTLKAHMQEMHTSVNKAISVEHTLTLMRPICDALTYAHNEGVLHRDVKPSNILIADDGLLFLTDFGLARMAQMGETTLSQDMLIGTPQYISPEQAQGNQELDIQTDVYSLGIVLFEMLTGSVPFSGDTPFAVIHDHIYTPLPLPHTINPGIDPQAEKVILRALAKDPSDRFSSVQDFWHALEAALTPLINDTPPVDQSKSINTMTLRSKYKKWAITAVGAILVVLLALAVFGLRARNRSASLAAMTAVTTIENTTVASASDNTNSLEDTPTPEVEAETEANELHREAMALIRRGKREAALEKLRQAIEVDPGYIPAYYAAADIVFLEQPKVAAEVMRRAINVNPQVSASWTRLGYYQLRAKENDEARKSFEEAKVLAPDSALPYIGLARLDISEDSFVSAQENIAKANAIDGTLPELRLVEGFLAWKQGHEQEAIEIMKQVSQMSDLSLAARADLDDIAEILRGK